MEKQKELISVNKVTWLNFILATFVVYIHTYNVKEFNLSYNAGLKSAIVRGFEDFIVQDLARGAVPLFFMLSAFFLYNNFTYAMVSSKLKSRIKSLLIPYLIWNTLTLFLFFILAKFPFISQEPFKLNIVNIWEGVFRYKYNLVFWFVYQLIIFVILSPIIYTLLKNKIIGIAVLCISLILACHINAAFTIRFDSLFQYLIGAFIAIHYRRIAIESSKKSIYIGFLLFFISQLLFVLSHFFHYNVFNLLFVTILGISLFFISDIVKVPPPKVIEGCSFIIFALHFIILEIFQKIIFIYLPNDANTALMDFIISPALTLLFIFVFIHLLKRFAPKILCIISGGRN